MAVCGGVLWGINPFILAAPPHPPILNRRPHPFILNCRPHPPILNCRPQSVHPEPPPNPFILNSVEG